MLATAYDSPMRVVVFVLAVAAAAGVPASSASTIPGFRTPSGNIGCYYATATGIAAHLRCDIRTGLKPKPPRPKGCVDLEWGDSFEMAVKGRGVVTCPGDTGIDPK